VPNTIPSPENPGLAPEPREWGTRIFLGFLFIVASFYAVILIYHSAKPPETVANDNSLLEQCRQICLKYGLVSSGNIRRDAEAYLQVAQSRKLTEGLSVILADTGFQHAASQPHALLNQSASDFLLPDETKSRLRLSVLAKNRPVVLVFYLGFGCSHCVAQLLALEKDLHYFRELDAEVVAISSDTPEHTTEKFAEYGRFDFPVLADVDYAVSQAWGVYQPETDERPEIVSHATFIVDRNGKVIWSFLGKEPFLDNKSLLHIIASSQGLMPTPAVANGDSEKSVTSR
jgi:peroxiredoxin Q/BCP